MTNYDRWKLATPDYLEDNNEEEPLHDTDVGGEDGDDVRRGVEFDTSHEKARVR